MQREIDRLSRLELLVREDDGPLVRWRVDENNPVWHHFRQLVRRLSDPADVLPYALTGLPRIDAAFIFGSHARDRARPDSDVDLFVLHRGVPEGDLLRQTLEAGVLMDREVNVVTAMPEELQRRVNEQNRFFLDVLAGPKQWVAGSSKVLADLTDSERMNDGAASYSPADRGPPTRAGGARPAADRWPVAEGARLGCGFEEGTQR
jgi:predicted nucleotidyltransferase